MKRQNGFTLIELLVVISIITLLISITLPALSKARAHTKRVVCGTQLAQIGQGFVMYGDDNKSFFPWKASSTSAMVHGGRAGTYSGYRAVDGYAPKERPINLYLGYDRTVADNADIPPYLCPADTGAQVWHPASVTTYKDVGSSYAYNGWASVTSTVTLRGRKLTDVRSPSRTIMVGDHPIHNYTGGGNRKQYWHDPSRIMANICFVDNHVDYHEIPPGDDTDYYTWYPWK